MKYAFDSVPVGRSGVLHETENHLDGERDVGACSKGCIHKRADSLMVGDVTHLGKISSGRWELGSGESNTGVHRDGNGFEVFKPIVTENRVDV